MNTIGVGCLVLAAMCVLLAIQQLLISRRLGRRIDGLNATFEGPARLELFGHVTHIGWVRQGPERIDLLTIEGEALQCDARARYRLTPLTWREFAGECLRRKEESGGRLEHEVRILKRARAEAEERRIALRATVGEALELFGVSHDWGHEVLADRTHQAIVKLSDAREKDDKYDELPF